MHFFVSITNCGTTSRRHAYESCVCLAVCTADFLYTQRVCWLCECVQHRRVRASVCVWVAVPALVIFIVALIRALLHYNWILKRTTNAGNVGWLPAWLPLPPPTFFSLLVPHFPCLPCRCLVAAASRPPTPFWLYFLLLRLPTAAALNAKCLKKKQSNIYLLSPLQSPLPRAPPTATLSSSSVPASHPSSHWPPARPPLSTPFARVVAFTIHHSLFTSLSSHHSPLAAHRSFCSLPAKCNKNCFPIDDAGNGEGDDDGDGDGDAQAKQMLLEMSYKNGKLYFTVNFCYTQTS